MLGCAEAARKVHAACCPVDTVVQYQFAVKCHCQQVQHDCSQ